MLNEFKAFIARGNVFELAVGIIIGAAFTAIVNSVVLDLINPILGLIVGGIDFSNRFVVLSGDVPAGVGLETARDQGAAVFAYGSFLMALLNFFIIAWVVFLLVRLINRLRQRIAPAVPVPAPAPTGPTETEVLLEIRDLLKAR